MEVSNTGFLSLKRKFEYWCPRHWSLWPFSTTFIWCCKRTGIFILRIYSDLPNKCLTFLKTISLFSRSFLRKFCLNVLVYSFVRRCSFIRQVRVYVLIKMPSTYWVYCLGVFDKKYCLVLGTPVWFWLESCLRRRQSCADVCWVFASKWGNFLADFSSNYLSSHYLK